MTTYTHDQIALMAKLVPDIGHDGLGHYVDVIRAQELSMLERRAWQPWSDWRDLGPLWLACEKWVEDNGVPTDEMDEAHWRMLGVSSSGDFDAFAAAVCNLAIEIGRACE